MTLTPELKAAFERARETAPDTEVFDEEYEYGDGDVIHRIESEKHDQYIAEAMVQAERTRVLDAVLQYQRECSCICGPVVDVEKINKLRGGDQTNETPEV